MINAIYWFCLLTVSLFCSSVLAESFTLTVVHGSGSGTYEESTPVSIFADPYEDPDAAEREPVDVSTPVRIFDRWVIDSGPAAIADAYAADTVMVMPRGHVTVTAQYKDAIRWTPPTAWTYFPPNYNHKIIFVFHGGGGSASKIVPNSEMSRFIDAAVARGYGIVAMNSFKQATDEIVETWDMDPSFYENTDMQRLGNLRSELIAKGLMTDNDEIYLFGVSGGGMFASLIDQNAQRDLEFEVKATALMISPGDAQVMAKSTTPTIFLLAENDTSIPNNLAVENFNFLVFRQVPAQLWVNPPSPVYPERFWRINHLSQADSRAIYAAIKAGNYLDDKDFLLGNPNYTGWQTAIPNEYNSYLEPITEQLLLAYAEHMVISAFSDKILRFFEHPEMVILFPPTINGFTPASGIPGTAITIDGSNFINVLTVKFNGVEATFQPISTTTLLAFVPEGAGSGPITVVNPAGSATTSADFIVDGPVITGVSPGSGVPGTPVTIEGDGFVGISSVTFNGSETTFQPISANHLLAFVPQGASTGPIAVSNSVGTATSGTNFVIEGSAITGFTPGTGIPGTIVTISGENFIGVSAVRFNGVSATILGSLPTQILATVPPTATTGRIEVVTSLGSAISSTDFTVLTPPAITGFAPAKGPAGTVVTLTGQFFTGATAVEFSGVAAGFTVSSDTQIVTTVPAGAPRLSKIKVTTPAGATIAPGSFIISR